MLASEGLGKGRPGREGKAWEGREGKADLAPDAHIWG
jgi:hypothetical protein